MIKYIQTFFYPHVLTYSYHLPKEFVIAKITEILKKKVTLFSSIDITGSFINNDTFVINTISPAYTRGVKYSSTLVGQIIESQNGLTELKTKAKPSFALYFLFFLTIILGLAFFYKFMRVSETEFLFWSLAMLFVGPAFSIGLSNVAIASIRERYKMYIDKELMRGSKAANNGFATMPADE